MGLKSSADESNKIKPMKSGNIFVWQGVRNLDNCYGPDFEKPFLEATEKYFTNLAKVRIKDLDCLAYLEATETTINGEAADADFWLQPTTKPKILEIVRKVMITDFAEAVVSKETGCEWMFNNTQWGQLKTMFRVLDQGTDVLKLIIARMNPYIKMRGEAIVQNEGNLKTPMEFAKKLLDFKAEIDEGIHESFDDNMAFQRNRDTAFQNFMNDQNSTPIFLAAFSDQELRSGDKGMKGVEAVQAEERLVAIINLFRLLFAKDGFLL